MTNIEKRNTVLASIKEVLCEKNKRYGNSALEPLGVFYKGSATDSIRIRLDDKLSRIKNSPILRKNDMYDLLGYLFLLNISLTGFKEFTFEENVDCIIGNINNIGCPKLVSAPEDCIDNIFDKENKHTDTLESLNFLYYCIKKGSGDASTEELSIILCFIAYIVQYFIENNITDFTDLID